MHNVTHEIKGGKLLITVDISAGAISAAPPSQSGKTALVGTTGGALPIASPVGTALSFAFNVMAKK
jgi:hypothetical protein